MADPFSVAAGVVSITVPALHGARLLLNDLSNIADAPRTIRYLRDDIASTLQVRDAFEQIKSDDWQHLGDVVIGQAKTTIQFCDEACTSFRQDIQRWTRHSKNDVLGLRDRTTVGFFKERQVKAMSGQLQSCKISLNAAISLATLYNSIGNTHITKNTRRETASRISIAIDTTSRQLANVETDLNQLRYQNPGLSNDDVAATLKQMEDERMALANANRLLEELRLKASTDDAISPTDAMNITFGANNSGVQTGTINGGLNGLTFSFGGR